MRNATFSPKALEQYNEWAVTDRKKFRRLADLIVATARDPFKGIGKPEPLKGDWAGCWSRRIDEDHRLLCQVKENEILIVACKGHYE